MKYLAIVLFVFMLTACNFKEGVKETGDAVGEGVENIVEGVKQVPKAIGDASNKIEADLKK